MALKASGRFTPVVGLLCCAAATAIGGAGCSPGPIDVFALAPDSLQTDLVAHWSFDDGTGTTLSDSSGNGRDGQISGGTWITGRFGGALHFDGAGAVTVPSFPQATSSWSIAGWVRPPAGDFGTSYITLISTELALAGGWELNAKLTPSDTLYHFGYWIGPGDSDYVYFDCHCVTVNEWTHLAAVVDASTATLSFYQDGVLQGQSPATQAILTGSTELYMARWEMTGRLLTGDLDDMAVYSRALAAQEIAELATAPVPAPH